MSHVWAGDPDPALARSVRRRDPTLAVPGWSRSWNGAGRGLRIAAASRGAAEVIRKDPAPLAAV